LPIKTNFLKVTCSLTYTMYNTSEREENFVYTYTRTHYIIS